VKDIIDKHLKALEDAPGPTIGFHVRWGDKIEEDILFVSHCLLTDAYMFCYGYIHVCGTSHRVCDKHSSLFGILACTARCPEHAKQQSLVHSEGKSV